MGDLDRRDAVGREHDADAADEVVEVGNLGQDVVGDQEVGPPPFGREPPASSRPKNSTIVSNPCSRATAATFAAGSIPRPGSRV